MRGLNQNLRDIYSLYQNENFIQAEIDVRNLLKAYPNNPDVLRLGALTALALNQLVTADTRLSTALRLTPMTAEIANTRGNILKATGDWAGAETAYATAIGLDPDYAPTYGNQLDLYVQSEQPHAVLAQLDQGRDYGEMGEYARSQALTNLGRYEAALAALEDIEPRRYGKELVLQRIKILMGLGRTEDMLTAMDDLPPSSALTAEAFGICVNALEMLGLHEKAMDLIAQVTSKANASPKTIVKAAQLLNRSDNQAASEALLKKAQSQYVDDPDILGERARAALSDGNEKESCRLYRYALSLRPGDLSLMMGLAQAAIVAGEYKLSEQMIHGAFIQAPNSQFLYALLATLKRVRGSDYKTLYNYDAFIRVYHIEPPDGFVDIETFNLALKDSLERQHIFVGTPLNQSLRRGTQTQVDLSLVGDPVIRSFFDAVEAPIRDYIAQLPDDPAHPLMRRKTDEYRISGAWSVRLTESGHHVDHVHPMGWLSSSYYVDVPSSIGAETREGWIKFGQPGLMLPGVEAERFIRPQPGLLVLFPSYMWHGTVPFSGKETRLTLPFDVVPA